MFRQDEPSPIHPLVLAAAAAVVAVCTAGIGAIASLGSKTPQAGAHFVAGASIPLRVFAAHIPVCAGCGVITAVKTTAYGRTAKRRSTGTYRVLVRLDDGSHRVLTYRPPGVDAGDRVRLADGMVVAFRDH